MNTSNYEAWPELPYEKFSSTGYLLHRCVQVIGKLKLLTPFEPEWANVVLNITARGLTTGLVAYEKIVFSIDIDFIDHQIIFQTISGKFDKFSLTTVSVAELFKNILNSLRKIDVNVTINPMPQEVPNPIPFDQDTESRAYDPKLANAWWRILVSSYLVIQQYHARFLGKTQPIGLMWGTFDLRDVRFKNHIISTPSTGPNSGYLRRNAMDSDQIESGWWSGNPEYPRAAYYSFTYPEPTGIEHSSILPAKARWHDELKLFILDYDDVRQSKNPENDLLNFLTSTFKAGAERAGWDSNLIGSGKPV